MFYGFGFSFLSLDEWKILLQAKLQGRRAFLFLTWGGDIQGKAEGPQQKGGSVEVCSLERELWEALESFPELPSDLGKRLTLGGQKS